MNFTRRFLMVLVLALAALPAAADGVVSSDQLTARFVAENIQTRPGDTVSVALYQKMAPGWHTYWINPGDSGQPPILNWQLPDGVSVEQDTWPSPHRLPVGPLVNYGYSDQIALLFNVSVPESWPAGRPLALSADAEILVCEEICIPVTGQLALDVATGEESIKDADVRSMFAAARAEQPLPAPWSLHVDAAGKQLQVTLPGPASDFAQVVGGYVFSESWGVLNHAATQRLVKTDTGLRIDAPLGEAASGKTFSGVITLSVENGPDRSFEVRGIPVGASAPGVDADDPADVWVLIALALAGGVLLNLMPCVFPVLAIKALGLVRHADDAGSARLAHGLSYTVGVVVSFLALAGLLLVLRAGGEAIGWGFQLQNPLVVGLLAYVCAAVGLNLSGVFEIGGRFAGTGEGWLAVMGKGHGGSFATGILAAVVAAPCTAPFMAAATGGALLLPVPGALSVFAALGVGLALPYLILSTLPSLARRLPKPGPWMVRFRQFLAFPMYATAAWLIWVLSQQAGSDAAFLATLGLICVAFACWVWQVGMGARAQLVRAFFVAVPLAGAGVLLGWASGNAAVKPGVVSTSNAAEPFTQQRLDTYVASGRTVFVNMTADWCITCKVNERVALSGDGFEALLARHDVVYLQGDWTSRDPEITHFLERFGRLGVPLYVVFPADGRAPHVLPQILTPSALDDALSSLTSGRA